MINCSRIIAALLVLAVLILPTAGIANTQKEKEIRNALAGVNIDSVRYMEGLDMYEVIMNKTQAAYLTKDMKYFIMGSVVDLTTRRNLTQDRINGLRSVAFASLNKKNAIKLGNGNGNGKANGGKSIAVFTDPNCGYCKKLHAELLQLKDVNVYVYLYALNPNSDSKAKAAAIWCSSNKQAALDVAMSEKKVLSPFGAKPSAACLSTIDENIKIAKTHDMSSSPTVVFEDGRVLVGYKSAAELTALINQKEVK